MKQLGEYLYACANVLSCFLDVCCLVDSQMCVESLATCQSCFSDWTPMFFLSIFGYINGYINGHAKKDHPHKIFHL